MRAISSQQKLAHILNKWFKQEKEGHSARFSKKHLSFFPITPSRVLHLSQLLKSEKVHIVLYLKILSQGK